MYAVEFGQKTVADHYRASDSDLQENPGTPIKIERRDLEQPDNIENPPISNPGIHIKIELGVYADLDLFRHP